MTKSAAAVVVVGETLLSPANAFSVFKAQANTERYLRGYNTHARDAAGWDVRGGGVGASSTTAAPAASSSSSGAAASLHHQHNPLAAADIVASVSGLTELTESIVSVSSMSPRYHPEVGDVVVGRIIDVVTNRWRCEVFGLQDATMLIRNVTGPGSILRRKGREDELTMRSIFKEDDVFVAEVQRINLNDGTVSLHIRSAGKYGKRRGIGALVLVRPALVPRMNQQFHTLVDKGPVGLFSLPSAAAEGNNNNNAEASNDDATGAAAAPNNNGSSSSTHLITSDNAGVQVVFGVNGGIWVGVATPQQVLDRKREMALEAAAVQIGSTSDEVAKEKEKVESGEAAKDEAEAAARAAAAGDDEDAEFFSNVDEAVLANNHRMVAIVSNCIRLLNARRCLITPAAIEACLALIHENSWSAFDIVRGGMHGDVADAIVSTIAVEGGGAAAAAAATGSGSGMTARIGTKRNRE